MTSAESRAIALVNAIFNSPFQEEEQAYIHRVKLATEALRAHEAEVRLEERKLTEEAGKAEREKAAGLREALARISDMPVLDWCSDLCTKWQPSKLAFEALNKYDETPSEGRDAQEPRSDGGVGNHG